MTLDMPKAQCLAMLDWFLLIGVNTVDIHLRVPKKRGARYDSPHWYWITDHNGIPLEVLRKKYLPWVRFMNSAGADIYIRPQRDSSHSLIFLDDIPLSKARRISQKYGSCVIETSPSNTQVWVSTTTSLTKNERKQAQYHLGLLGYTDPASVSGDHLGRVCGMKSQKHGCWVNYICGTDGDRYHPHPVQKSESLPPRGGVCLELLKNKLTSQSEKEFGWVLHQLRNGIPKKTISNDLENRAAIRGKRNPAPYVQRTIANAYKVVDMQ